MSNEERKVCTSDLSDAQCRIIVRTIREILYPTKDHLWDPDTLDQIAEVLDEHDIANPEPPRKGRPQKTA